jgi:hypothetical protein
MIDPAIQDELDKTSITQLHSVVLQLSGNCFELKKLCVTVLVSAGTLVATFAGWRIDAALLGTGAVVTSFFWILDGQSYYYQEKLRARMKNLADRIAARGEVTSALGNDGVGAVLSEERAQWNSRERGRHALLNQSMAFYWMLIALLILLALLFHFDLVHTLAPQKPR